MTGKNPDSFPNLADVKLTPPEIALFTALHYGITAPPSTLPAKARLEHNSVQTSELTEEECRAALEQCLGRGWLQIVDESALARITDELRAGDFLGPMYGMPPMGTVDFTAIGADLWVSGGPDRKPNKSSPDFAFPDAVHIKAARYFRSRKAALTAMSELTNYLRPERIIGPTPIGPWRVQWWRRFDQGYRLDIEERPKWQGHCGGGGELCVLRFFPPQLADPKRLQHILDRHNITLVEWRFLSLPELGSKGISVSALRKRAERVATEIHGRIVSGAECLTALENCLRNGWLRVVDLAVLDEVDDLIRDDPTVLPVPSEVKPRKGKVDFTATGATLYRMLMAEWLGPDWEDNLTVEYGYYREVHYYCETKKGLQDVPDREAQGQVIRASRLVPIGPWCVHWWERFPAGFRLELEIGQP